MTTVIANRYDFVHLFDVTDGNPNGDPDAGNMPRVDPETGHGLVTDVALKRKVRNYVGLKEGNKPPFKIYVREGSILKRQRAEAYGATATTKDPRRYMCDHFFDIRAFGAVMPEKGKAGGQVRGPVQLTFARSVAPILSMQHSITRVAIENEKDEKAGTTEMGNKSTVAYGLYRAHGFVSPHLAAGDKGTGFTEDDLALLWEALCSMFDHDRSAARGLMATRRLIVFRHDSMLGNAQAHKLFERVTVSQKAETPRAYGDFEVSLDTLGLPAGITLHEPCG